VPIFNGKNSLNKLKPSHPGYHGGSMTNSWIIRSQRGMATKNKESQESINLSNHITKL
jgi:hypothetical protein